LNPVFALFQEFVPMPLALLVGHLRPVFCGLIQAIEGGGLEWIRTRGLVILGPLTGIRVILSHEIRPLIVRKAYTGKSLDNAEAGFSLTVLFRNRRFTDWSLRFPC